MIYETKGNRTVDESTSQTYKLNGIGGWLILPAIGLIIALVFGGIGLFSILGECQDVARMGAGKFASLCIFELILYSVIWVFTIYATVRFFRKKKNAPKIMIILCATNLVAPLVVLGAGLSIGLSDEVMRFVAFNAGEQSGKAAIAATIWIPYFKISRRVKTTFVN